MSRIRLSLAGVGVALASAVIVPGNEIGLGLFLVVLVLIAVVLAARPAKLSVHSICAGGISLVLASMSVIRTADWIVMVDLTAAVGFASLAVAGGSTWRAVVRGMAAASLALARGLAFMMGPLHKPVGAVFKGRGAPVARGFAIAAYLLVLFGFLFATADKAFLHLASRLVTPDVGVSVLPARIYVFLFFISLAGALIVIGPRFRTAAEDPCGHAEKREGLSPLEWAVPLTLLNALFLGFVAVQLTVLFGGHQHVLRTVGLGYAQYARSGFFQLVAVALLVLAVIAAGVRWARTESFTQTVLLRGLLGLLCISTLIVLASALKRLGLYEEAYGFTRLRISVHATILLIAVFFLMLIVAGLSWQGDWLPRASVYLVGTALIAFSLINPDATIARENVERFTETGRVDAHYLTTLSVDAAGSFDGLTSVQRNCLLREFDEGEPSGGWISFNLARFNARDELAAANGPAGARCLYPVIQ